MVYMCSSYRVLVLVLCVGFLSVQPEKALGIRNLVHPLRQIQEDHRIMLQSEPTPKATSMQEVNTKKKSANANNKRNDPNRSSKRRVRRGSDPIHNRQICIVKLLEMSLKRNEFSEPPSSLCCQLRTA
ncbi:CLAVATA3/ESR (CLE)-related protein 45 [Senna tora]|uniref:CLAVATA3/ESR (CLE)-related protein 45 n=1 Tax=Senna tora TaxID=362788 RepID=A0A834SRC6_9FABA|nr:CLAVATA3/ESR (CLE)-related protein 45 [Senna tora]